MFPSPLTDCLTRFRGHDFITQGVLRELVLKGYFRVARKQQSLSRFPRLDVGHFVPGDVQVVRQDFRVIPRLVQNQDEVRGIQYVLDFRGTGTGP